MNTSLRHSKPSTRSGTRRFLATLSLGLSATLFGCVQVPESSSQNDSWQVPPQSSGEPANATPKANPLPAAAPHKVAVPAPLAPDSDVLEIARTRALADQKPQEFTGLHNVYPLSEQIISGGEPLNAGAMDELAKMGIKTILSVDGKAPDWAAAEERGMRYVHIPIQYRGLEDHELEQIVKTFQETEGPFYVHCYHGQHRGPAAAAIGRVVLDGIAREDAMAEMLQWCGTAPQYKGLFEEVAFIDFPTAEESAVLDFDFPKEQTFEGVRAAMIPMARHWDAIKDVRRRDWQPDPNHPDLVVEHEAQLLAAIFQQCVDMQDYHDELPRTEEVQAWFEDGQKSAKKLAEVLAARTDLEAKGTDWKPLALDAYQGVAASCKSCHNEYRND